MGLGGKEGKIRQEVDKVFMCSTKIFAFLWIQEKAKETREKVKRLLQLADGLVDKGHAHAPSIKKWVEDVDATYKDFR